MKLNKLCNSLHEINIPIKNWIRFLLVTLAVMSANPANAQFSLRSRMFINPVSHSDNKWQFLNVGFAVSYKNKSNYKSDSIIQIDTITESEFYLLSQKYNPKILFDSSMILRNDSSFTIKDKTFEKTFPAGRVGDYFTTSYLGIIAPLNLHIIKSFDSKQSLMYSSLIDRKTGRLYNVPSNCLQGPNEILISTKNNFLLTYSNTCNQNDKCCIYLLKIESDLAYDSYKLNNHIALNFEKLNIEKLVWLNDNTFAMVIIDKLVSGNKEGGYNRRYLKVRII